MSNNPRTCQCCYKPLVRKRYGKRMESYTDFDKRRFCSQSCSNTRTPEAKAKKRKLTEKPVAEPSIKELGKTLDPLEYMLEIMNDPKEPEERRDKMAISAAKYVHSLAMGGKKEDRAAAAKKAISGRFAPSVEPKIMPFRKP